MNVRKPNRSAPRRLPASIAVALFVGSAVAGNSAALAGTTKTIAKPTATKANSKAAPTKPAQGPAQKSPQKSANKIAGSAAPKAVYPNENVIDLATGKPFNLSTLSAVSKPTLMFIWAPH